MSSSSLSMYWFYAIIKAKRYMFIWGLGAKRKKKEGGGGGGKGKEGGE